MRVADGECPCQVVVLPIEHRESVRTRFSDHVELVGVRGTDGLDAYPIPNPTTRQGSAEWARADSGCSALAMAVAARSAALVQFSRRINSWP